jgi:beta-N-acetylhexosaminidase
MAGVSLRRICGSLVIGGFAGTALPSGFEARLRAGELGGAILFARNVTPDSAQVSALCASIAKTNMELPPIVSVDQEGGRVARIKHDVVRLPPAIALGRLGDDVIERAAMVLGEQLAALGFSMDYAPVLDVHTNPKNPVIGDRAFATTPERAASAALAFARGLMASGIAPCGKHFPGHGDTLTDSHLELPRVTHDRARLDAVELAPFRAAAKLPAFMSAHVVYDALDPKPATLSKRVATELLRGEIGFGGVLISDDLEMKAVSKTYGAGEAAVLAVEAGCDALLVCSDEDAQVAAVDALAARAENDAAFRARCEEASARVDALRRAFPPKPTREVPKTPADLLEALARLA